MRVSKPRVLTYQALWQTRLLLAGSVGVGGVAAFVGADSGETRLIGAALVVLALTVFAYRHVITIDGEALRVRDEHWFAFWRIYGREWRFADFDRVALRAGGGSSLGGAQAVFQVLLLGRTEVTVPKRCFTLAEAYYLAGEAAEALRVKFDTELVD